MILTDFIKYRDFAFKKTLKDQVATVNFFTHNLYSYPAKFIPHVPYYVISKYLKKRNGIILDPFAGSSSTAVEALRLGHNSISIDLNPLTNFLTVIKTQKIDFELIESESLTLDCFLGDKTDVRKRSHIIDIKNFIDSMKETKELFFPNWNNIDHWYPSDFKQIVAKMWGYIYSIENQYPQDFINLIKLTALYLSRYLSYGARDIPKLFKSKRRIKEVGELEKKIGLNRDIPFRIFKKKLVDNFRQMDELTLFLEEMNFTPEYEFELSYDTIRSEDPQQKKVLCLGNTDILTLEVPIKEEFIDLIVTSPPYIYAQEYIRSTKLDLYWLNLVNDAQVREVTKKELGMKNTTDIEYIKEELKNIASFKLLSDILEKKESEKYKNSKKYTNLTYNYFYDMFSIIRKLNRFIKEKGVFALFVGNPTILGHQVLCHKIFHDFFNESGYNILEMGYDRIISPRLLKGRQNESPNGMNTEWLIIAQKKRTKLGFS